MPNRVDVTPLRTGDPRIDKFSSDVIQALRTLDGSRDAVSVVGTSNTAPVTCGTTFGPLNDASRGEVSFEGKFQTTDATANTVLIIVTSPQPDYSTYRYYASVVARRASDGASYAVDLVDVFKRNGGAPTRLGTATDSTRSTAITDSALSALSPQFAAVGNSVVLRATGIASTLITWTFTGTYLRNA